MLAVLQPWRRVRRSNVLSYIDFLVCVQDFINSAQSGIHTHHVAGVVEEHVNDFFFEKGRMSKFQGTLEEASTCL